MNQALELAKINGLLLLNKISPSQASYLIAEVRIKYNTYIGTQK